VTCDGIDDDCDGETDEGLDCSAPIDPDPDTTEPDPSGGGGSDAGGGCHSGGLDATALGAALAFMLRRRRLASTARSERT